MRASLAGMGAAGFGTGGVLVLGPVPPALAATGRVLKVDTLAATSAVNVPMQYALREGLGKIPGFAPAEVRPTAKIPEIAQEVIAGATELGDADVASTLAAAEAGADLKIIGLSYNNTDQVIVTNTEKTKSLEDLAARGGTIAVNGIGDFMYVMLLGVLDKKKIDRKKINFIEMGSSGDRARALLAGRVDAVPMHIEQAAEISQHGHFDILVRPWTEFDDWFSAVITASDKWLRTGDNAKAAVAVLTAVLTSFRRTNQDYAWYKEQVGKYASAKPLRSADDASLKPVWTTLTTEIRAFPAAMEQMTPEMFAKVVPVYKAAGALKGTIDLHKVIDRSYLDQAIKALA